MQVAGPLYHFVGSACEALTLPCVSCVCHLCPGGVRVEQDAMEEGAQAGGTLRPLMGQRLVARMQEVGAGDPEDPDPDPDPDAEVEGTRRDRREAG